MKKLSLAIIGQGRSGKDIHGAYYLREANRFFDVRYVVDADDYRRNLALSRHPGCKVFADYRDLFGHDDIDLVVNATYSNEHFSIAKDLLEHGFNVLTEKPFAADRAECETLLRIAREKGVLLAVFQQTFYAPIFTKAQEVLKSGRLGKIEQISIRYNGFARRWDWQTLQWRLAGSAYNTGPHPIGLGLGFIGFPKDLRIVYSKLDSTPLSSGDADDYVKILFTAPGKALVDIEISATDAFPDHSVKIQGTRGTYVSSQTGYKMKYIVDGENSFHGAPCPTYIENADRNPTYCREKLVTHEEVADFAGDPFSIGTDLFYEDLYYALTEGRRMQVTPEMAAEIIDVIHAVHVANPLPRAY